MDQAPNLAPPNIQNSPTQIPDPPPLPNLPVHISYLPPPYLPAHIPNPPSHIPNPVHPLNIPAQVPNPVQPQTLQHLYQVQCNHKTPPAHVPIPGQPQIPPAQVPNPVLPQAPPVQMPQLNWSYFKPEISGKPEEDVEAHLLRTNDWMETHNFPEVVKVQRFCLTLTGEARLWYETLRPIEVDLDRVTRML